MHENSPFSSQKQPFSGECVGSKKLKHQLVPKHFLVPKEKVQELMKKLQAEEEQLPLIEKGDPAIKHLRPEVGNIIKIVRKSHTAGKSYYYRRVVL